MSIKPEVGVLLRHRERPDQQSAVSRRSRTRSTKTAVSKLVLATFPELNQAFDVGERLTLPLPVSFDPVKGVNLIFQLPWRKLSRGCIFDKNAHTTQCFEKIWLLTYSRHQMQSINQCL
jgi:hypothetical protein